MRKGVFTTMFPHSTITTTKVKSTSHSSREPGRSTVGGSSSLIRHLPRPVLHQKGYTMTTTSSMGLQQPTPRRTTTPWTHLPRKERPWRSILQRGSTKVTFIRPLPRQHPVSSSWPNRMVDSGRVLIFCTLNKATVKFCYPLPLVPATLKCLQEATIFTMFGLRSTYNLFWIRKGEE